MNLLANRSPIEWAIAQRTMPGEDVSGDLHVVATYPQGALLAVVDGLGHGPEAALAAEIAVTTLVNHCSEPIRALVNRCHAALKLTRGVVMTVVCINFADDTLTWLGIGNVVCVIFRRDADASRPSESVLLRGGLVGGRLPALLTSVVSIEAGDLLVLASDGIANDFDRSSVAKCSAQRIADYILSHYYKGTDDGLVLVVRYLGSGSMTAELVEDHA